MPSNFDDVFASFDRPTTMPPTLPDRVAPGNRQPSPVDDPNLKSLLGMIHSGCANSEMGFSRGQSLEALEKHNYNLSEVCRGLMRLI
jgi:hypothetical protein